MKAKRPILLLTLFLGLFVAVASPAQDAAPDAPPAPPNFQSLTQNWWSYFEGTQDELEPRIETFLERVNGEIAELGAQNQELAPAIVEAVRDNLDVYLSLLDEVDIRREPLPEPDPANIHQRKFAWMTVHKYNSDKPFRLPFKDFTTLKQSEER